jgi:hypothetical protein
MTDALLMVIAFLLFLVVIMLAAILGGTTGARQILSSWFQFAGSTLSNTIANAIFLSLKPVMWILLQTAKVTRLPIYVFIFLFRPLMRYPVLAAPLERAGWIAVHLYGYGVGVATAGGFLALCWVAVSLMACGSVPSLEQPLSCLLRE